MLTVNNLLNLIHEQAQLLQISLRLCDRFFSQLTEPLLPNSIIVILSYLAELAQGIKRRDKGENFLRPIGHFPTIPHQSKKRIGNSSPNSLFP
jgi:hypothetical protein